VRASRVTFSRSPALTLRDHQASKMRALESVPPRTFEMSWFVVDRDDASYPRQPTPEQWRVLLERALNASAASLPDKSPEPRQLVMAVGQLQFGVIRQFWRAFTDTDGNPFRGFYWFCLMAKPYGLGVHLFHALNVLRNIVGHPKARRMRTRDNERGLDIELDPRVQLARRLAKQLGRCPTHDEFVAESRKSLGLPAPRAGAVVQVGRRKKKAEPCFCCGRAPERSRGARSSSNTK
jgi:hypothetical protein